MMRTPWDAHTWTISLARNDVASVHYCSEAEAKRIADHATKLGQQITDCPREMTADERACGLEKGGRKVAA
jgi:hypothetical protein